ncbi:DUF2423 domain-containing protein [Aspergillus puulaauensis]|uniref:DUF2423 domain-containing protein n=1 Tax=Aspergillus puulaauensis TaxID=1220207 RepID=A0A7R8AHZ7_9EURO|nr:uncharacterized protein APUU_10791S [Aspergillus puulaauensis]BCS17963.1 hypothetical protein APUU_10791S [Aspergillus puulaauensis]
MAKSVRASVQKRNKAKLRSTVFGPAVDARTERLSAKLQELASQPKPSDQNSQGENTKADLPTSNEAMDIDSLKTTSGGDRSQRRGRIQKRQRNNRSSIVFKPHPSKTKKTQRKSKS